MCTTTTVAAATPDVTLRGFTASASNRERALERTFLDLPSAAGASDEAQRINKEPHYAGTPGDYSLAVYMRDQLRSFGFEAELEALTARVDTPHRLVLQVQNTGWRIQNNNETRKRGRPATIDFDLREIPEPADPDTSRASPTLPFNAGSGDGDIVAPLVFVNRGVDDDYQTLDRAGVSVRGAIAIVRYGAQFRGNLALRAQQHGASGVIFYSDPKDDGGARGAVYPSGPWRPLNAVQRGSVGEGIRIPTLPISAANARVLLGTLVGKPGPDGWGGKLPVAYGLGRGPSYAHLVVNLNRTRTTLWNTVGRLHGATSPTESVVLGAHRDAWVYGVTDNGSGVITMLEIARGLGYLAQSGWRPRRTIVIAGWDGEEIGLVGSKAYVAAHHAELARGCIAYINADENVAGPAFGASATAAIGAGIIDATRTIGDPNANARTIFDRWIEAERRVHRDARIALPEIASPGGGSDHESFLSGLGTPVANLGFNGPVGVYHSAYDDFQFASTFADPGFALHRTAAQIDGVFAMRLAEADVAPYTLVPYLGAMRSALAEFRARSERDGLGVDLTPLRAGIDRFASLAINADAALSRVSSSGAGVPPDLTARELSAIQALNAIVYGVDGYDATAFPTLSAAFATRQKLQITAAVNQTVGALSRATNTLSF